MIAVCANRSQSLAWEPGCLVEHLFGRTRQHGNAVVLERRDLGFLQRDWRHVSGVVLLDLIRGVEDAQYTCTVLTNPWAAYPIAASAFPRGRVLVLDGETFRWVGGQPGVAHGLIDGTSLLPPD